MKDKYDVIIIGSGIGGLIAGAYLAKAGIKVLIVEKNDRVGGSCVSFKRRGYIFDAGAHIIGSCGKNQMLGDMFDKLGVKIDFIKFNPTDRVYFSGRKIDISTDVKGIISFLEEEFSQEAENIDKFFDLMSKARNNLVAAHLFSKYKKTTYKELLDGFFKNPFLKNILSFGCGYLGLPPSKLSALSALFLLRSYLFEGAYYPRGGAQVFSDAIANRFREYGGKIALRKKAKRILCKKNIAVGIIIDTDTFIDCDYVISNADCHETFFRLIGIENIKNDKKLLQKLNNFETSASFFVMYLAIKNGYDLQNRNGWYFGSNNIDKSFYDLVYLHIPTLIDDSVAPKGKDIVEMGTAFPYNFHEVKDWKKTKKELSLKNINLLEKILPDIKNYIEFYEAASPKTIFKYTLNTNGALYGWEQNPSQVFANSFPSSTSAIDNLILAGHWTFPGGGVVSAAFSGMIAAQKILKRSKKPKDIKVFKEVA